MGRIMPFDELPNGRRVQIEKPDPGSLAFTGYLNGDFLQERH
jgi:hypothetical protein